MCSNTGTYIDVPFHRYADGHDLTGLPLERIAGVPAVCIDARGVTSIGPELLDGRDLDGRDLAGHAVLFRTDHSRAFGTPDYLVEHPHLAVSTAEALVAAGVACVGIDSLNIDAIDGPAGAGRPVQQHPAAPRPSRSSSTSPTCQCCLPPGSGSPRCHRRSPTWARSRCAAYAVLPD